MWAGRLASLTEGGIEVVWAPFEDASQVDEAPEDGVLCEGFYLVGARWNREKMMIWDSYHNHGRHDARRALCAHANNFKRNADDYECPLYKTAVRAGVLTTTGASSNYVVSLDIPTDRNPDYWVRMGVAALCALAE